ncbi:hypothetical protein DSO57_1012560 [Entomophthora muscae]|uniref:Uncharacterized protein n=1 Tax=Entomophthora muscae TaxID=34485 RepID=A0ACC2TH06_9FUNG|nr:hypothetical protein DSO57_1012560 [Entomophthora muscae]
MFFASVLAAFGLFSDIVAHANKDGLYPPSVNEHTGTLEYTFASKAQLLRRGKGKSRINIQKSGASLKRSKSSSPRKGRRSSNKENFN